MKVVLFANTDWYLYNFRRSLALAVRDAGHDVVLVSPPGSYGHKLRALGFRWIPAPMERRSLNPLRELALVLWLRRLVVREQASLVHGFTIKCAVYGSLAARMAGVPARVNAVAGMGYVFTSSDMKARMLRPMVSTLMRFVLDGVGARLILQNPDDVELFERAGLVASSRVRLIAGSGVDCERFRPPPAQARDADAPLRVVLPARLLWDKGLAEYIEAARILHAEGRRIEFLLAGDPDSGNPAAAPEETIRRWVNEGLVQWLGHVEDMPGLFQSVDAVVLPSYREGLPKGLIEAAACARPLVTTDAPGCRQVVTDGVDGLLVPVRDAVALARAIATLQDDEALRARLGAAAREKALREFDERSVIARTLGVYRELLPQPCPDMGGTLSRPDNMASAMTIVKASVRSDILLIYQEVERQLRHNGWKVNEYVPSSSNLLGPNPSLRFLLKSALISLTPRAIIDACRDWRFFFEGRRPRLRRLLDFLSFSKYLDAHPATAVFILNQRHSGGACHAARVRGIPIVTHQHGDYYNDRVPLTQPLRDVEGPDTIRIVWNEESRDIIEKFAPRGSFRVAGSLKHAAIQRDLGRSHAHGDAPVATQPGIVFFETIFPVKEIDRSVTQFNAAFLAALQRDAGRPVYIAAHPLRSTGPTGPGPFHLYGEAGIGKWDHSRKEVEWAICSDSNALYDLVFAGIPCLHLKREDSCLAIPDAYPGTIRAEGDCVARVVEFIGRSDRTHVAKAQLAFLQDHKIGTPSSVDRCFSELLAELAAGKVTHA